MSDNAMQSTNDVVAKSAEKIETSTKNIATQQISKLEQESDKNLKSLKDNGSPTTFKPEDIEKTAQLD